MYYQDKGIRKKRRRVVVKAYYLPEKFYNGLMHLPEFEKAHKRGEANLGGIPVYLSEEFKIDWFQAEKQRKFFREKRRRKHGI